jgi:choline kinase
MKVIILAGGLGTRLAEETTVRAVVAAGNADIYIVLLLFLILRNRSVKFLAVVRAFFRRNGLCANRTGGTIHDI